MRQAVLYHLHDRHPGLRRVFAEEVQESPRFKTDCPRYYLSLTGLARISFVTVPLLKVLYPILILLI